MATQALYRVWRPTRFSDVVGQDAIVTTLRNQVASGRVSHAYLFCGSRGTGKTTSAKIFARAVNCLSPIAGEPCGTCAACEALSAENALDIVEIDAASNNGVDEIRDLRDKVKYPPQLGRYRVYIIDEVHMLSTGAFNALLKTLEEPPPHALFILATTEPKRLPATVLSRCQRFDFRRIPAATIVERMREVASGEAADVQPDAFLRIARAAEGGMRDALSLLDMCLSYGGGSVDAALVGEVLGAADRGSLFAFVASLLSGNASDALRAIDALMRSGREPQVFARDVTQHLRALLLAQTCGPALAELLETTDEDARQYAEQAERVSRERLLVLLDLFLASETDMKWSSQPRVALELAAARACLPDGALQLEALASRVDLVEKRIEAGIPVAQGPAAAQAGEKLAAPKKVTIAHSEAPKPEAKPAEAKASDEIWNQALREIRKEPYLYAPIMQGKLLGISGDALRILFSAGGEIYLNMLKQADKQQRIEAILSQVAGRPITLQLEMETAAQPDTRSTQHAAERVFDLFGRENVQVVDE